MKILIISTGGTIDSGLDYNQNEEYIYRPGSKSMVKTYIEKLVNPDIVIDEVAICLLDSADITDEVRDDIVRAIHSSITDNIIITHGTDTMVQTGKYLAKSLVGSQKRIILVGSFYPLLFAQNDAGFNLGFAFGQIQHLASGVYIAMNATVFDVDKVEKDRNLLRFVPINFII